jgi:GntR family transcriptional regulator of arabinose operon
MKLQSSQKLSALYAEFKARIETGEWKAGDRLPTASELARTFKCSGGVVSKAITMLAHDGLVEQKTKVGTRVIQSTPMNGSSIKMNAFGFIYPSRKHQGISRLVQGFETAAHRNGRQVVLLSYGTDFQKEIEFITRLVEFDVYGAVIYPILGSSSDQIRFSQILADVKFPIVLAEVNVLGMGRPSVTIDGYHAGYTMTRHLLETGKKRIGFLSNYSRNPSVRDRYLGYRAAMEEDGITIQPEWVIMDPIMKPNFFDPLTQPEELGRKYLSECGNLEGVVCVDDFVAHGLIKAAAEKGIVVPRDLKVTGMEDIAISQADGISLTSYRVSFEDMGEKTFEVLEATHQKKPLESFETQVRGNLVIRESTK